MSKSTISTFELFQMFPLAAEVNDFLLEIKALNEKRAKH